MPEMGWGAEAEDTARRLAANLGGRDFVYEPVVERSGSRTREISDGLLICGEKGLILQTKARHPESAAKDSHGRATSWIHKNSASGARQVNGTRRRLSQPGGTEFRSLRGHPKIVNKGGDWPGVVILFHPDLPPGIKLPQTPNIMWITLDDWYGLHDWLRSTTAVIGYVQRALASGLHPELGREIERYAALAESDRKAKSTPTALPSLPSRFINGRDRRFAAFVDEWIDAAARQGGDYTWEDPDDYRAIVELLDAIHPEHRVALGKKAFETISYSDSRGVRKSFFFRLTSLDTQFLFVAAVEERYGDPIEEFMAEVSALALTRHEQFLAADPLSGPTLALGRLRLSNGTAYQTLILVEDVGDRLDVETRWIICEWYGVFSGERGVRRVEDFGRNEKCPCLSGRKVKKCHRA